ncbi:MAG: fused MFS/spermidine synthase [Ignavibacteriae bacterium]|nr:fused MFS/spermidine synthase [Ignavibacteriota bacterium]
MKKETLYSLIAVMFITSGAIGLVYEIVWFKYLSLFLGNTTYAQSIVLASFMAGLAIGASLWGNRADKVKQPLAIYAVLEIIIGIYGLLYPMFFELLKSVFINTVIGLELPSDGTSVLSLKLLTSLITLLPPTILMGGTLPVLVRHISERIEESGKNIAILYFLNSFGAVIGSFLGGFFFVRTLGLDPTIYMAAVLNITIGVVAFLLTKAKMEERPQEELVQSAPMQSFSKKEVFIAFAIAGFSGLCSMMYEVAWVRLLIPVLGSSTYSFSIMLITFISGITIGSWLVSKFIERMKNMFGFLAVCQFGVVLSLIATLPLYGYLPYTFWHAAHILNRTGLTYPLFLSIQLLFSVLIMIVPTIFLGMSLPVASRIATSKIEMLGKSVGSVFSINTIGTVLGSLGAGLMLIPLVGIKHTIEFALVLNLALGILVAFSDSLYSQIKKYVSVGLIFVLTLTYFFIAPDWSRIITLSGVFRNINDNDPPPSSYQEFLLRSQPPEVYFYKEGTTATVAVTKTFSTLYGEQKVLVINGKGDASSKGDMPTQVLLAQFPAMLHPKPETTLVIGLGSGATAGSLLSHPIKQLDCVEISPEVVEAMEYFSEVNHRPQEDPRFRLYIEDALAFLNLTKKNYDIIVSEPSNPWIAGIGNLYTIDFFEVCKQRLRPNGLMVQWFHLYEMDDETLRLVFRTFQSVFPHVSVWQSFATDVILIGSLDPLQPNFNLMKKKFEIPRVKSDLENINMPDVATLLSMQVASENTIKEYAGYGEVNTEKLPYLEYWAPRSFFINSGVHQFITYDERSMRENSHTLMKRYVIQFGLNDTERLNIINLHSMPNRGKNTFAYAFLRDYLRVHQDDKQALSLLADVTERMGRKEESLKLFESLAAIDSTNLSVLENYGWSQYLMEKPVTTPYTFSKLDSIEKIFQRTILLAKDTVDRYRAKLADVNFAKGDYEKAIINYKIALQHRNEFTPDNNMRVDLILLHLAQAAFRLNKEDVAMGYVVQAYMANPNNPETREFASFLYMKQVEDKKAKKQ